MADKHEQHEAALKSQSEILSDSIEIRKCIYTIRDVQVMIDSDLAVLYQVETKRLSEQVKRNLNRFPNKFRFQLTQEEVDELAKNCDWSQNLRSQTATSSSHGGRRYLPYAFTEQGVAMLSAVLRSEVAVRVSIQIMDAFVEMRRFMLHNAALFLRLDRVEHKQQLTDQRVDALFCAMESGSQPAKQGIFFDGQVFDAYVFVNKLIKSAKNSIALIDNFVDESVLEMFSSRNDGVSVIILTHSPSKKMELDIKKHNEQYPGVEIRAFKKSHDRFLILDEKEVYHIGASLKDLGKRWFAFSRLDLAGLDLLKEAGVC